MVLSLSKAVRGAVRGTVRGVVWAAMLAAGPALAQYTPTPPPLDAPCVPTKKDPCTPPAATPANTPPAAEKFPFPGEPDAAPAAAPGSAPAPDASAPAKRFPFPGEPDATPPASAPASGSAAGQKFPFPDDAYAGSSSGSSSSSSSSGSSSSGTDTAADSDKPALADKGSSGSTRTQRRHLAKVEDMDGREAEDLEVSKYYASTGNFTAAYMRAQDAIKIMPNDPLAHYWLANSALKLKKTDEAIAEFRAYLKMDPDGEKAKDASRALEEIAPK